MNIVNNSSVTLVDYMGSDARVVNSARVSMAKHISEDDFSLSTKDEKLIEYLAKNGHWTPFSHVMFTFRISMPIFVARQWFKHTVGLTRNEVSRRYVDDAPEYFIPEVLRARPNASIKQGSGGPHPESVEFTERMRVFFSIADKFYSDLIGIGIAPEQARAVLPVAHMTEFYETGSLAAYARIAALRLDPHAQAETRDVAEMISDVISGICPISWQALQKGN